MANRFFSVYFLLLIFLMPKSVGAENFWYSFENNSEYEKIFAPRLIKKAEKPKPVVLFVKKNDDNFDDVMSVLNYLCGNGSIFTCPAVSNPVFCFFGKISKEQKIYFEAQDAQKLFVSWDDLKIKETKKLYKSYHLKLEFLRSTVIKLDKILSSWKEKNLPARYLDYTDLKNSAGAGELSYADFLKRLFRLMDKLSVALDDYPQLYSYNEFVLKKIDTLIYPQDQVMNERDMFHNELTKKSGEISSDEISFLLETVIENRMTMASFKDFMDLMRKIKMNFPKNYPAYYGSLYLKAWYNHLRSEQTQNEISACVMAVYNKVNPEKKFLLIEKWIEYKDALLDLLDGKISYDEYHLLKSRLRVYKIGAIQEHEKQVLREIRSVWNDTIQDQIDEVLRGFYNYVIYYENLFKQYEKLLNKEKIDIVAVIIDDYDLPAMYFWFSSIKTGSIIEISEPVKEDEPAANNYFKLMRGERSPFEKLLEGIGDEQK